MNNDNNINKIEVILDDSLKTVGDYITLLIETEYKSHENNINTDNYLNVLQEIVREELEKPFNSINTASFLLSLYRKDKNIGKYYLSLVEKYGKETTNNLSLIKDKNNIFHIVENLLHEASVIVHPDNEIDKYFNGANYSFAVGVKLEEFYKYVPDQSIQEQIQTVMRNRVAFLMTLLQMRTEKYGILADLYLNDSVFSRELSLCILYHSLEISLDKKYKDIFAKYSEVKKRVEEDIKVGILQLPDRRVFEIKSLKKKALLKHELKTLFINENDFSQNGILRILNAFIDNVNKISNQVFPVVAVRDPITGKIIRVNLTKYGPHAEEMGEVDIPKFYILNDDVDEYVRKQLAKRISNNSHESIEVIVKDVLKEQNIDSERTVDNVVNTVRPSVYAFAGLNRKLLVWLKNFDAEKTVVGNLAGVLISQSMLPSKAKESLERVFNIKGLTIFSAALGGGIAGLPGILSFGLFAVFINRLIKTEKPELSFSKSFLNNVLSYSKNDLSVLALNGHNPYVQMLKFILKDDEGSLKEYKKIFESAEKSGTLGVNDLLHQLVNKTPLSYITFNVSRRYSKLFYRTNVLGVKTSQNVERSVVSAFDILKLVGLKIGVKEKNIYTAFRRSKENLELIKTLSQSGFSNVKKTEALEVLGLFAKNSAIFGLGKSLLGAMMIKQLTQTNVKRHGLAGVSFLSGFFDKFLTPQYQKTPGESFFYSFTGRFIQRVGYDLGKNIGLFSRRNGPAVLENVNKIVSDFANNLRNTTILSNDVIVRRATISVTAILAGLIGIVFFLTNESLPFIVANSVAYGGAGGGGTAVEFTNPNSGTGGLISSGICPLEGRLSCAQGPVGGYTHVQMGTWPVDISPANRPAYPAKIYVYAVADGTLKYGGNSCANKDLYAGIIATIIGNDGNTYEYYHVDIPKDVFLAKYDGKPIKQKESIGALFRLPIGQEVDHCWSGNDIDKNGRVIPGDGTHLHIQAKGPGGKSPKGYLNAEYLTVNTWKCDLPGTNNVYCSGGNLYP